MEINADYINSKASELNDNIDYLQVELNKLKEVVSSISSGWSGEEATEFIDKMENNYLRKMNSLIQDIDKYQVFLEKTPGAYQMLDDIYAEKKIDV